MSLYEVIIIPTESELLTDALGISEERKDFFLEKLREIVKKKPLTQAEAMENISQYAENPNELMFLGYVVGQTAEQQKEHEMKKQIITEFFKSGPLSSLFDFDDD